MTETGTTTRTKREAAGLLSNSGAAAMSRPFGRKPYGRAAAARSSCPAFRRSAVPAVTLR